MAHRVVSLVSVASPTLSLATLLPSLENLAHDGASARCASSLITEV
jgi:hypothetical protein